MDGILELMVNAHIILLLIKDAKLLILLLTNALSVGIILELSMMIIRPLLISSISLTFGGGAMI